MEEKLLIFIICLLSIFLVLSIAFDCYIVNELGKVHLFIQEYIVKK